jgi:phage recombination protein Bet
MNEQQTTALATKEPRQWLAQQGHSEAELDVLRRFICADYKGQAPTDGELMFFMLYCRQHKLDPFSRQAHLLKTKNGPQVCLGIDGMRIRAAQSREYGGQDEPAFEQDPRGQVVACRVVVYRMVQGQRVPFPAIAWMAESRGASPIWAQRPRGMLEKCAEAKALRKAFPESCGAFYAPEELDLHEAPRARGTATASDLNARLKLRHEPPATIDVEAEPEAEAAPLPSSTEQMVQAFAKIGIRASDILEYTGRESLESLTDADMKSARAWYAELTSAREESE